MYHDASLANIDVHPRHYEDSISRHRALPQMQYQLSLPNGGFCGFLEARLPLLSEYAGYTQAQGSEQFICMNLPFKPNNSIQFKCS
jgi:hypothetical protein